MVTVAVGEEDGSQRGGVGGGEDHIEEVLHIRRGGDVFACHERGDERLTKRGADVARPVSIKIFSEEVPRR